MRNILNPELLAIGRQMVKQAFVDAGQAAGGPGAGDPSGGGGDPSGGAMPPMADAMGGGGAPPGPPPGPPPMTPDMVQQMIQQALANSGGGGAGGGGGPIKPKIDVNVEIMQIKKMLAKVVDALGIQIPASDMTATSQDLTQMALNPGSTPPTDPSAGGGGQGAIPPIQPMEGALPPGGAAPPAPPGAAPPSGKAAAHDGALRHGQAFDAGLQAQSQKAAALRRLIENRRQHAA